MNINLTTIVIALGLCIERVAFLVAKDDYNETL